LKQNIQGKIRHPLYVQHSWIILSQTLGISVITKQSREDAQSLLR